MSGVAWFDDRPLDAADARVPIDDASVMLGDGVFESIAIGPRGPFAVTRHIRRLRSAAERIGIDAPSEAQLRRAIATVAEAASQPAMLRVTVAARGVEPGSGARLIVTTRPLRAHGEAASAAIGPWVRNEVGFLAGLKSTSWGENAAALRAARRYGADEALFVTTRGDVCEGASCNVFAVIDGHLATPPLSAGCLPGITRELLLEHGVAGTTPDRRPPPRAQRRAAGPRRSRPRRGRRVERPHRVVERPLSAATAPLGPLAIRCRADAGARCRRPRSGDEPSPRPRSRSGLRRSDRPLARAAPFR